MTVKELLERLKDKDPEAEVLSGDYDGNWYDVDRVDGP